MQWFDDLSIGKKLGLGFGVIIVLVAAIAVYMLSSMRIVNEDYMNVISYPTERSIHWLQARGDFHAARRALSHMSLYAGAENAEAEINGLAKKIDQDVASTLSHFENLLKLYKDDPTMDERNRSEYITLVNGLITDLATWKEKVVVPVSQANINDRRDLVSGIAGQYAQLSNNLLTQIEDTAEAAAATSRLLSGQARDRASFARVISIIILIVIGLFLIGVAFITTVRIKKPILRLLSVANDVANGNLNINIDTSSKDETGFLAKSFADVVAVMKNLANDINANYKRYELGDISHLEMDTYEYSGQFADIITAVNKIVLDLNSTIFNTMEFIRMLGEGDFKAEVIQYPGEKIVLTKALQTTKNNLLEFNNDIASLIRGAGVGDLSVKVDTSNYKGDWSKMASGLNNLMDTVSTPVEEIMEVMKHLSIGNFDLKMNGNYKGDFLTLKESVNSTIEDISSYIDEITSVLTRMAQNDFDQVVIREYVGDYSHIKDALNNIIDTFNKVIGDISSSAEQVSSGARAISESSMTLATGASEQASSVEELSATIQVINQSTTQNAESAKNAESFSNHANENAAKGDQDMKAMLVSMEGIKDSSNRITNIIKVIQDIAFQTNLLALNAAVEAARAGEHGKGFAVVAEEVRTLAGRSQTAAKETAELIDESISRVDEGSKMAEQTAKALKIIVEDISKIAGIIVDIASSSKDQSAAIEQVTEGLTMITNVVQNNSTTSEESASAAEQLSSQAELLHNLVSVFKMKRG